MEKSERKKKKRRRGNREKLKKGDGKAKMSDEVGVHHLGVREEREFGSPQEGAPKERVSIPTILHSLEEEKRGTPWCKKKNMGGGVNPEREGMVKSESPSATQKKFLRCYLGCAPHGGRRKEERKGGKL